MRDYAISRRAVLGGALGASVLGAVAIGGERLIRHEPTISIDTHILDVRGKPARVYRLTGPDGRQGMTLAPGQRFQARVINRVDRPAIVHWHGQTPPWKQDGVPWSQTPPMLPGGERHYDFAPISGTYWMHSHEKLQLQAMMSAPLIVHDERTARADRQEVVMMLNDFSFTDPQELLDRVKREGRIERDGGGGAPAKKMSMAKGDGGKDNGVGAMAVPSMKMDLNDIHYDAFLANDRTLDDPEVVRVERGGALRLRIINAAASSGFWIDLGALSGKVVAVDGRDTVPVAGNRFPVAMAQRIDVLVDLPPETGAWPITAQLEGSRSRTGLILASQGARVERIADSADAKAEPLDMSLEYRLRAAEPLAPRKPDLVHRITLGGSMSPYRWTMNGEAWPNVSALMLRTGQRVEIELVNPSMMAHPIHLHGHSFQVLEINGKRLAGALRDVILVPAMGGSVRIAFDANNPGRWPFHCHNLYHLATGMMTEFRYHGIL